MSRPPLGLSAAGLLGLLIMPQAALAGPSSVTVDRYGNVYAPLAYAPSYRADYPVAAPPSLPGQRYALVPVSPAPTEVLPQVTTEVQLARRCNIGRLVGGVGGGGLGYAASRQDGRSWAVPLGALLGQQMGCNISNSKAPLPW
jgi:hypothetical protein